jgi:hypothetical protein
MDAHFRQSRSRTSPISSDLENKVKNVTNLVMKFHFTPYYEDPFMEEEKS